jgi:hypothetical protein
MVSAPDKAASAGNLGSPGGVICIVGGPSERQVVKKTSAGVTSAIVDLRLTLAQSQVEIVHPATRGEK